MRRGYTPVRAYTANTREKLSAASAVRPDTLRDLLLLLYLVGGGGGGGGLRSAHSDPIEYKHVKVAVYRMLRTRCVCARRRVDSVVLRELYVYTRRVCSLFSFPSIVLSPRHISSGQRDMSSVPLISNHCRPATVNGDLTRT